MSGPARLRLKAEAHAVFVATECTVADGLLTATGAYEKKCAGDRVHTYGAGTYSWPIAELRRCEWLKETDG